MFNFGWWIFKIVIPIWISSLLGNEEPISSYELHIGVKDSVFFGSNDRLIGVSVMQLKDIQDQVKWGCTGKFTCLISACPCSDRALVGWPWAEGSKWMKPVGPFSGFCRREPMTRSPRSLWSSNPKSGPKTPRSCSEKEKTFWYGSKTNLSQISKLFLLRLCWTPHLFLLRECESQRAWSFWSWSLWYQSRKFVSVNVIFPSPELHHLPQKFGKIWTDVT